MTAWVYRCLDSEGAAVYVGTTRNLGVRLSQHQHSAAWWTEVSSVLLECYDDAETAHDAEIDLIFKLQPSFNVYHRGPDKRLRSEVSA